VRIWGEELKYGVITNDVNDYLNLLVRIAHTICNHPLFIIIMFVQLLKSWNSSPLLSRNCYESETFPATVCVTSSSKGDVGYATGPSWLNIAYLVYCFTWTSLAPSERTACIDHSFLFLLFFVFVFFHLYALSFYSHRIVLLTSVFLSSFMCFCSVNPSFGLHLNRYQCHILLCL
jgi:hypothetical protein